MTDREAFEKYCIDNAPAVPNGETLDGLAYWVCWQAACKYKDEQA